MDDMFQDIIDFAEAKAGPERTKGSTKITKFAIKG